MNPNSLWFYVLENVIYRRKEPPPRTRTVPMEVLAVGLPRSGTESLKCALLRLGYDECFHGWDYVTDINYVPYWARLTRQKHYNSSSRWCFFPEAKRAAQLTASDFDPVIGHCRAITDSAAAAFAYDLIHAYPDAKVLLNKRTDLDAWERSVDKSLVKLGLNPVVRLLRWFDNDFFWLYHLPFSLMYPVIFDYEHASFSDVVPGKARQKNLEHSAMVRGAVPKERLLEWSVEDGWEPLCAFLGKAVPKDMPFPSSNAGAEFNKKVDDIVKARVAAAIRNLAICVSLLVAAASLMYVYRL
jgi:hypothetical protein